MSGAGTLTVELVAAMLLGRPEAPVNDGSNYNCLKVAKYLVG